MSEIFRAEYIEEPDLVFGGQKEEKDPRIGLKYHGPYYFSSESEPAPSQIRIGIVGNSTTITLAKQFIEKLKTEIPSQSVNKWLYPDYPGFTKRTSICCDIATSENWEATIKDFEISKIIEITDDINRRIAAAANLFKEKIHAISLEDNKPDVIICALPLEIEEYCGISERTRGAKTPKVTPIEKLRAALRSEGQQFLNQWGIGIEEEKNEEDIGLDLHNALKGKIMSYGIPIQIFRESSARGFFSYGQKGVKVTQEPATFAWNFSTALYYKANGKPWRLAKLRQDTCYVGISFFRNLRNPDPDIQTSMAQVFTHNGEGIVLRGTDVITDHITKEPHMSSKQARILVTEALKMYREKAGRDPSRIVIHKTSLFSEEEKSGFNEAIGSIMRDYVSINKNHDLRFLRVGQYPVLRGAIIHLSDTECLLYTTGYVPRVRTYPGHRIPKPLYITHQGDTEIKEICKEIMGLTKLNWNTTAFSTYLPITLEFSEMVGKILSELVEDSVLQKHYRFYM